MPSRSGLKLGTKMNRDDVLSILQRFSSIVIWGLRTERENTQRHIHRHFYTILKKLGLNVIWCDDKKENQIFLTPGSLVLSYNGSCAALKYRKDLYFALLNTVENVECKNFVKLRIWGTVPVYEGSEVWSSTVAFHKESHTLWQAWATDLLPEEFLPPVFSESRVVYWVGSIWNDGNNHGNIGNIEKLKKALADRGLEFEHRINIIDTENMELVRQSRIAPAIGGDIQVATLMIPCRVWKNISYGQLGVTNLPKVQDVFGDTILLDTDIDRLVEKALLIGSDEYKSRIVEQQKIVAKEYTYLNWFFNLGLAFEKLELI